MSDEDVLLLVVLLVCMMLTSRSLGEPLNMYLTLKQIFDESEMMEIPVLVGVVATVEESQYSYQNPVDARDDSRSSASKYLGSFH